MFACNCFGVTERQVRQAVRQGADTLPKVRSCTGVTRDCGQCACKIHALVADELSKVATAPDSSSAA